MRSRSVQTTNIRIGKRFTERIGHELHQAATYALKQDWEKAQRVYEEVAQMIDTFLTETGIGKYMEEQADARAEIETPAADVGAESEPPKAAEGTKAKDPEGGGDRPKPSRRKRNPNKGTKRSSGDSGSGGTGTGDAK